jgi:hypothetical protein
MCCRFASRAKPLLFGSAYLRWLKEERCPLFPSRIGYAPLKAPFQVFSTSLEKLGSPTEVTAFSRLTASRESLGEAVQDASDHTIYYTRKFGYFLAFLDFIPRMEEQKTGRIRHPSELKTLCFRSQATMRAVIAALSSSTFFWFWNVLSDCRNLNRRDLLAFPLNPEIIPGESKKALAHLGGQYLKVLRDTSRTMLKSGLRIETFDYSSCKPILDEIDRVLAKYYGFTDEELDFILNYDIKYRMGQEEADEE